MSISSANPKSKSQNLKLPSLRLVFLPVFSKPFQFGDGRVAGGRPTMIGVGERRGVGTGVKAGRGDVADGRGVEAPVGTGTAVEAASGVA